MKIVCDACGAKYSIADDKVQGKVFKIRCKKCSNIIVVRGTAGAAAAEEPAAAGYDQKETRVRLQPGLRRPGNAAAAALAATDAVWHVWSSTRSRRGPITARPRSASAFAAGQLDSRATCGVRASPTGKPMGALEEFAGAVAGAAGDVGGGGGGSVRALAGMFGGDMGGDAGGTSRSDAADLFGSSGMGAQAPDDGGGELFGSRSEPEPEAGAPIGGSRLRGERNENSVLFSLNNLAQLASDAPRADRPAPRQR
ncbi:MAG: zinc-ribbon domain-containing protein [Kofleriaceae bacterium]